MKADLKATFCLMTAAVLMGVALPLAFAQQEAAPTTEAPIEAPAEIPASPVETPLETPVETPLETPVETPLETVTGTPQVAQEFSGEIVSVDLANSNFVIKYLTNAEQQLYENATIYVTDATIIDKNYEAANLEALVVGDKAYIGSITDTEGRIMASYIWVERQ